MGNELSFLVRKIYTAFLRVVKPLYTYFNIHKIKRGDVFF